MYIVHIHSKSRVLGSSKNEGKKKHTLPEPKSQFRFFGFGNLTEITQSMELSRTDKPHSDWVTRGNVSYEFFFPSGNMSNLAYIGAKNLNF